MRYPFELQLASGYSYEVSDSFLQFIQVAVGRVVSGTSPKYFLIHQ
jgi:hypothetical protein